MPDLVRAVIRVDTTGGADVDSRRIRRRDEARDHSRPRGGVAVLPAGPVRADIGVGAGGRVPDTARDFSLVGHSPLAGRGMNAGLAVHGRFAYVGNRTDGSSRCGTGDPRIPVSGMNSCPHLRPGIMVVDVADPARPVVAGEFGAQFVTGANVGQTSRELRVWPSRGCSW